MLNLWLQRVHTDLKYQYVCMCLCEHKKDNVHMCIYIYIFFFICYTYTLSLPIIHIHIFMAQTHFGTLNVFLFNFTGPGMNQSMLDCTLSLDAFRGRMSNRDQPFHVT